MSLTCRICNSPQTDEAGEVEYFSDYAWKVFDCRSCGCRFTRHDNSIYELLHASGAISHYKEYSNLAESAKRFFNQCDAAGLQSLLTESIKYRFIIHELISQPREARLLEIGCSRGYLTSWAILDRRNILGVDVSDEAVNNARAAFGEHFVLADSPAIQAGAPYDCIYHVGLIGCVADPIGLTKQLLGWLKPGGRLLFNAPNRAACEMSNQLWFDSAPPPDVVTLFPPGFWRQQFLEQAKVQEGIEWLSSENSFKMMLPRFFGRGRQSLHPPSLRANKKASSSGSRTMARVRQKLERGLSSFASVTQFAKFFPRIQSEFGLFVKMVPRTPAASSSILR